MSNIIDKIQVSGVTYDIGGSGGGGKAIEAGRGIAITTGETADTVSLNLSISAGTGDNSVIEGRNTKASGDSSHSEGYGANASGYGSHAEGYYTKAIGDYSHAEGYVANASGETSHAEGDGTKANGRCSHAEGSNTRASGYGSHTEGLSTIANNYAEHASGRYNVSSSASTTFGDSGNTLFSVGNGTSSSARHNAFEIRQNGDIYLSSGGTDIKLQDHLGGGGGGGNPTVELTQAEYEALVTAGTVAEDTYYIITDAQAGDLTQYWTSAQTQSAITQATSGLQETLVSGTNIKTINNESILGSGNIDIQGGGGGKAIEAGRGIAITTGATADTVSVSIPISAGTGTNSLTFGYDNASLPQYIPKAIGKYSIAGGSGCSALTEDSVALGYNNKAAGGISYGNFAQGYMTTASGNRCHSEGLGTSSTADASHSEGHNTVASGNYSHSEGDEVNATNQCEHSQGRYNVSNKANTTWGDSGNTLFSVGNGTAENARHNAFEIRQNGDIYCSDGTNDVKLQDTITATAANTTALGGLSLVKLSQSEYDALAPDYDSNTLYVIVN